VFFGCGEFPEHELYRERKVKDLSLWEKNLGPGWYVDKKVIDEYILLSIKNEEGVYDPESLVDAEILVFKKEEEKLQYLIARRKHIDGNFFNFICRFSDGKQFRSGDINNDSNEETVFLAYIKTFLKEFEIVF